MIGGGAECRYKILTQFNPKQIILDYSQAFYAPSRNCLATIYSPRKFFGIPDGGLLITQLLVKKPQKIDTGSLTRATHLLQRLADTPQGNRIKKTKPSKF